MTWYCVVLAVASPGVWLLVVLDWDNEFASWEANWVGYPVGLLAVPTAFLLYDVAAGCRLPPRRYAARCLLEVGLVPVWAVAWIYFVAFGLGWVGP